MSSFTTPDGDGGYQLTSTPRFPLRLSSERDQLPWTLGLAEDLPITLDVKADGPIDLDLRPFLVEAVDITAGDAPCAITLPSRSDSTVHLSGGNISVRVPVGVGVRVLGTPSADLATIGGFTQEGDALISDGYEEASVHALIIVRPGTGQLRIESAESALEPLPI
jgi:hypothetical protein